MIQKTVLIYVQYPVISAIIKAGDYRQAKQSPFIQGILAGNGTAPLHLQHVPRVRQVPQIKNIDLKVLHPRNQSQTVVTPLIDQLSKGLFRERLHVLRSRKPSTPSLPQATVHKLLLNWLSRFLKSQGNIEFGPGARRSLYCNSVRVNYGDYNVSVTSLCYYLLFLTLIRLEM